MTRKLSAGAALLGCLALLAGCAGAGASKHLSSDFGNAKAGAMAAQTANPKAGENRALAEGQDGQAAVRTVQKYRQSFDKPDPRPVYTINLGH